MGVFCPIMVLESLPDLHAKAMLVNRLSLTVEQVLNFTDLQCENPDFHG